MNIYDVLRALVQNAAKPSQQSDMINVINDLERLNAFGTIGQQHSGSNHECVAQPFDPRNPGQQARCIVCGKAL